MLTPALYLTLYIQFMLTTPQVQNTLYTSLKPPLPSRCNNKQRSFKVGWSLNLIIKKKLCIHHFFKVRRVSLYAKNQTMRSSESCTNFKNAIPVTCRQLMLSKKHSHIIAPKVITLKLHFVILLVPSLTLWRMNA